MREVNDAVFKCIHSVHMVCGKFRRQGAKTLGSPANDRGDLSGWVGVRNSCENGD